MPSRLAVARSMSTNTCRPPSCKSLVTSARPRSCCNRSTRRGTHSASSCAFASSTVNWYWVRLTRSSIVRSCTGCMYSVMPSTSASERCSLRMTSTALASRFPSGFRLISMRPLLSVTLVPSTPMNDDRLSTAGSARMTSASACCRSAISANDTVAQERERDQDGDQRERERDDREADLLGALQRRLQRRFARFDVAGDVLDHHDRVVDDEASGDRQRHQRQVVDREAGEVHDAERADERKRHRDARNDRRRNAAQEQEDDHDHEGDGEDELEFDVGDRRAN